MKKLLWTLPLILVTLIATFAMPTAQACYKEAELISTGDGGMIIETGENIVWLMHISVSAYWGSDPFTDIVVTDNLAAELEIDSIESISHGTVDWYTTGNSEKIHLTWNVGTLNSGERAHLYFYVSTDHNPAGKQEYTSCGWYTLNSGPTMKYRVLGKQYSYEASSIWIQVLP